MPIQRITSGILANGAIVAADIADGIVTNAKLAGSITSDKITSVSNTAIAGLIQSAQIGSANASVINAGTLAGARLPAGSVLQVVSSTTTTGSNSTSDTWAETNLSVTITPSSASSKIFVSVSGGMNGWAGSAATTDQRGGLKIYRKIGAGSFAEVENTQSGQQVQYSRGGIYMPLSINYLDTPNTTEAVIYKLYFRREAGELTFSVVRDSNNQAQITAMEIAG